MNANFAWFLNPRLLAVPETARHVKHSEPRVPPASEVGQADAASFLRARPALVERRPVVLFPTDLSERALVWAATAISVAREVSGRLVIFHALHLNLMAHGPANVTELTHGLRHEAELKCEPLLELARAANVPVTLVIIQATPGAAAIVSQAKKWGADIVLLTERPRNWLTRLISGRTIDRVIRDANCPVMVLQAGHGQT